MAKNTDGMDSGVKSKKEKRMDIVIFIVLAIDVFHGGSSLRSFLVLSLS